MNVTILVEDALDHLYEFKKKHLEDYEIQLAAWKLNYEKYIGDLELWSLSDAINSKRPSEPYKPVKHNVDYNKLIKKLKLHEKTSKVIELNDHEYSMIFEDRYGWTGGYLDTTLISAGTIASGHISSASISTNKISEAILSNAQKRLLENGYKKLEE